MKNKKLIFVSSPLRGDFAENQERTRRFCKWVMMKFNFTPLAPHIIFTQWLNDNDTNEQKLGIEAGFDLLRACDEVWAFCSNEKNASTGMRLEIDLAKSIGKPLKFINPEIALNEVAKSYFHSL